MAEHFHWTLDYIESLPVERLREYERIQDARNKAGKGRRK